MATLVRRFVDVSPDRLRRSALEVCALARASNEALLRDALGLDDAHELFAWLRELSFVESRPEGLVPHELAREVLDADLRWRDPEQYKSVFRSVQAHVYQRLEVAEGRQEQQRAVADLKYLFRNLPSVLAPIDWDAWGERLPEPAAAHDHAAILDLVERHEGPASAAIAQRWLGTQPDGFSVVRDGNGEVSGVLALLDLSAASDDERRADPGALAAWEHAHRHGPPRAGEVITQTRFVVDRERYQDPSATVNAIPVLTLQRYVGTPRLAWDYLALHEPDRWDDFFALADLPRAGGADFTIAGRRYGLFAHDFRRVPIGALVALWTERALAQDPQLEPASAEPALALAHDEFVDAARHALRHLDQPDLLARNPLLRTRLVRDHTDGGAPGPAVLERLVREPAEALRQHPRDDKLWRAVHRTFLQPAGTQEAAAEVLGLPFSTYRRHLTQGVDRIVGWLWDHEMSGCTGDHG